MNDITEKLKSIVDDRLKRNELLSKHLNYRIGGPARWFVEVRSVEELEQILDVVKKNNLSYFILGGGSNTLASDDGFDGVVIRLAMRNIKVFENTVIAEAGAISSAVARQSVNAGLKGLEWAISLPGTIGGAVRGNAGCFGGEIKDVLKSVKVLRDGNIITLSNADLSFQYRDSRIKHNDDIIVSVEFELKTGNKDELIKLMSEKLTQRKDTQPLYAGSAGCIFKNYEIKTDDELNELKKKLNLPENMIKLKKISAGWLIDQLDLKGKRIGGAMISKEHGNFIVNFDNATASDIIQLISIIKMEARNKYGIELQEEIKLVGFK